jgi:hypothetical protein
MKVDCRRQCAGFYKGFGNFFFGRFGHWTISDCEDAMCPYQSTFATKVLFHVIAYKRKTSQSFNYGFY